MNTFFRALCLLCLIFSHEWVAAQKTTLYSADWKPSGKSNAAWEVEVSKDKSNTLLLRLPDRKPALQYQKGQSDRPSLLKVWYPDGKLRLEAEYEYVFKGTYTEWHPNGQKKYEGKMKNGLRNGVWRSYHENGVLKARQEYINGVLTGNEKLYSEQGQLTDSSRHQGGQRSGKRITWSSSGTVRSETLYEKGSLTGLQRYYFASGALHYEELCDDGGCSVVSCRDSLGQVLLENGSGIFRTYHSNGQVSSESGYVKGVRQSIQRWDPQGQLRYQAQYNADTVSSFSVFNSAGRILWNGESGLFSEKDSIPVWKVSQYRPADSLLAVNYVNTPDIYLEADPKPLNMDEIRTKVGYPQIARDLEIQGSVIVRVLVSPSGKVETLRVMSTYIPLLEEQVLAQIYKLRFDPGVQQGEATRFWVNIPFNFRLL